MLVLWCLIWMPLWCLIWILGGLVSEASGEVFTAMADMEVLLHSENEISTVVDQYIKSEMKRLERIKE